MDRLTNEQNLQSAQSIDLIDPLADEIFTSPEPEPVIDVEGFDSHSSWHRSQIISPEGRP